MLHFEVVLLVLPKYGVFLHGEVYLELVSPIEEASLDVLAINWVFNGNGNGGGVGGFGGRHSAECYVIHT
jgi:hypothetical protein